jgi:glutaredoxin 3
MAFFMRSMTRLASHTLARRSFQLAATALMPVATGGVVFDGDNVRTLSLKETVLAKLEENAITVFSKKNCFACVEAKRTLDSLGLSYRVVYVDNLEEEDDEQLSSLSGQAVQNFIARRYGHRTVPAVFVGQDLVGGRDHLHEKVKTGEFQKQVMSFRN